MEKHSDYFRPDLLNNAEALIGALSHNIKAFYGPSFMVAMNQLSNHDHSRFLTRTNHKAGRVASLGYAAAEEDISKAVFREAVTLQMTWHGAPTLYYGDEAGVCGFTDPDNRRTYPWGHEDQELIAFHREMIRIRKENPVLRTGSGIPVLAENGLFGFVRFNEESQMLTLLNNTEEGVRLNVPVWMGEVPEGTLMQRLMMTTEEGFSLESAHYLVYKGVIEIFMPPFSAAVLRRV